MRTMPALRAMPGLMLAAVVCGSSPGCSWVRVSDAGETVKVVSNEEVVGCERLGTTKARVAHTLWLVPRRGEDVERELDALARNEGAGLGGNVVTPMGEERAGLREFAVYTCGD